MELKDILSIVAMGVSPVIAVVTTLIYQHIKEKRNIKQQLFLSLMAHRKKQIPTLQLVDALNSIDVVFHKNPSVLKAWKIYLEILYQQPADTVDYSKRDLLFLELLHEMGRVLGYKNLKQTDIYQFYIPQAHGYEAYVDEQLRTELLRVLRNTASVSVLSRQETHEQQ